MNDKDIKENSIQHRLLLYIVLLVISLILTFAFARELVPGLIDVTENLFTRDTTGLNQAIAIFVGPGIFVLNALFVCGPAILAVVFLVNIIKLKKELYEHKD